MNNISKVNKIPLHDVFYFRQRQKNKVFQSVIAYFAGQAERNDLTKKQIAQSLEKDPAQITRWFSGPKNWTLDTISDLLLSMESEMKFEIVPIENNHVESVVIDFNRASSDSKNIDRYAVTTTDVQEVCSASNH